MLAARLGYSIKPNQLDSFRGIWRVRFHVLISSHHQAYWCFPCHWFGRSYHGQCVCGNHFGGCIGQLWTFFFGSEVSCVVIHIPLWLEFDWIVVLCCVCYWGQCVCGDHFGGSIGQLWSFFGSEVSCWDWIWIGFVFYWILIGLLCFNFDWILISCCWVLIGCNSSNG